MGKSRPLAVMEAPVVGRLIASQAGRVLAGALREAGGHTTREAVRWYDYRTPTIHGMARVRPLDTGARLDLLAIDAVTPGRGHCREFIRECQQAYEAVAVWEIENQMLYNALYRWGFRATREDIGDVDVVTGKRLLSDGLLWVKGRHQAPLLNT